MSLPEVVVQGLATTGDGVARMPDGRVVFVEGAFPGDEVRIELTQRRRRVQYARLVELLKPSPDREPSACDVEACGGCVLRGLNAAGQTAAKKHRVLDAFQRIGHMDVGGLLGSVQREIHGWHYRHRVRLHASYQDKGWVLGYFARRSRRLVPFEGCPVLWPELSQRIRQLSQAVKGFPRELGLMEISIAYSRQSRRAAAVMSAKGELSCLPRDLDWVQSAGLSGLAAHSRRGHLVLGNCELAYDHAHADNFALTFEPSVFTQGNPAMNNRLVERVMEAVRPHGRPRVLELHAGIGNFTLPLAWAGTDHEAVERNPQASTWCRRNLEAAGLAAIARQGDDVAALSGGGGLDVVLLDPPRTGARGVAERLAATDVPRVAYISCDPATLARDCAILGRGGFALRSLEAFDMFPQTPHIELLCLLERQ